MKKVVRFILWALVIILAVLWVGITITSDMTGGACRDIGSGY